MSVGRAELLRKHINAVSKAISLYTESPNSRWVREAVAIEEHLWSEHRCARIEGISLQLRSYNHHKLRDRAYAFSRQLLKQNDLLRAARRLNKLELATLCHYMLETFSEDDNHSRPRYREIYEGVSALVGSKSPAFLDNELAFYEVEHGDRAAGFKRLARPGQEATPGALAHRRAFAKVKDDPRYLALVKAAEARSKPRPETWPAAPSFDQAQLPTWLKRPKPSVVVAWWPSGHLQSARAGRAELKLTERPGRGSYSSTSGSAHLHESYQDGYATWTIATPWNDGDDGGRERIAFAKWVRTCLDRLKPSRK